MAGATNFDKQCHRVFNGADYLPHEIDVCCGSCGHKLRAYYCEERLYLIECAECGKKALAKAKNAASAAYKTFAHEVLAIEDMGEDEAVFFGATPINDAPYYVGTVIDCNFPDDLVCGMYLPYPGTRQPEKEG